MRPPGRPRVVLAAACAGYLLLPWPAPVSVAGLLGAAGAAAAVWTVRRPGSLGPLALLGLGVATWLVTVPDPGWARAVVFGGLGYTVHAMAALCAAVPAGVRLEPAAWRDALARGALAVGVSAAAVTAAGLPPTPAGSPGLVGLGLLAAAAVVGLPRLVTSWSRE